MKPITSRDNPLYKELKQLATSSQARRRAQRTLLDGVHLCEVYLDRLGSPPLCIVSDSALSLPEVTPILRRCEQGGAQCIVLPDALFKTLSQVEHGVGLLFMVATPTPEPSLRLSGNAVLLDRLQDPGNLGSILRSAAAAGITDVFCSAGTAFAWSPKVLRAGMGAHFLLRIAEDVDLVQLLQSATLSVLATSSHAKATIYDIDLRQPAAWLFGHEGQGISDQLMALTTHQVGIPHLGQMESLNVAASAAVCFFEQVRQRR
ncbi:MAG: RNA methyltransferase [Oxalobacteraceae bacterium]